MAGILLLAYIVIFLVSPKDITDYTVADTEYWRETGNRLMLKTAYEYNSKEELAVFPKTLGEWRGFDYNYSDYVYKILNADILLSRTYVKNNTGFIWIDLINSKVGSSFHKQKICLEGAGWRIDNESVVQFNINNDRNPFTKLYANRLDYSKGNEKQIMVYWFMFKKFGSKDEVAMVRISKPVIQNETVDFSIMKDFVENELFNAMYKKAEPDTITVAEDIMNTHGNSGKAAIAMAILIPFGLIFAGIRRKN
jgi:hypothetical protein